TAWQYTLDHLSGYFERAAALSRDSRPIPPPAAPLLGNGDAATGHGEWQELLGGDPGTAPPLRPRAAPVHPAPGRNAADPAFTPEPFSKLYQRSIYQSMRNMIGKVCQRLARDRHRLQPETRELADRVIGSRDEILKRFRTMLDPSIGGMRIRCHGDLHLGQLLFTGKDFVIIDFEGEGFRTIEDRRGEAGPPPGPG